MTQYAWASNGLPVDAASIPAEKWEALKLQSRLGDFVLPCCQTPAVLKTSINGMQFFAHLSDECANAPETVWHKKGKVAVLAGLSVLGMEAREEVVGKSPTGHAWKADVLFSVKGRTIAIELQRSYQHLRDYTRRQERYTQSGIECYWLTRQEQFMPLCKATARLLLKRDYGNVWPTKGIGTGSLPELPVAWLETENGQLVMFGGCKSATVADWLCGIVNGTYQYREGLWNLG